MTRRFLHPTPANFVALRTEAGLSQTQVANMLHLATCNRISAWEQGKGPIDPARWELLLILLDRHPRFQPIPQEVSA